MTIFDAHIHLSRCESKILFSEKIDYSCLDCALTPEEFKSQDNLIHNLTDQGTGVNKMKIYRSFGIHPWYASLENLKFLEGLLRENLIDAIGECGLDFYTEELKMTANTQLLVFEKQLDLAARYNKPLIVHGRKCVSQLFDISKKLSSTPGIIFHGWSGSPAEAMKLLEKGVNCYFSFGKELLKGRKLSVQCVKQLPANRLLLETDAPYQTLKNEEKTSPEDILKVLEAAKKIRPDANFVLPDGFFSSEK